MNQSNRDKLNKLLNDYTDAVFDSYRYNKGDIITELSKLEKLISQCNITKQAIIDFIENNFTEKKEGTNEIAG